VECAKSHVRGIDLLVIPQGEKKRDAGVKDHQQQQKEKKERDEFPGYRGVKKGKTSPFNHREG